jgi:hypothetical protein
MLKKILSVPLALLCIFNTAYGMNQMDEMDQGVPELVPIFDLATDKMDKPLPDLIPLIYAAAHQNNSDAVAAFLQTDFNRQHASIALNYAAKNRSIDTLQLLGSHPEIDIYSRDDEGRTTLHWCCVNKCTNAVNLLLSRSKQGIDMQDYNGHTALHIATFENNRSTVKALLQNGASTTIKSNEQKTALANCHVWGRTHVFDNADLQQVAQSVDDQGNTQIHLFATTQIFGTDSYLEFLMQHGVSLWSQNIQGKTALDLAYEEYCHTLKEYKRKRIHRNKEILENQERVWQMFLRVASKHMSCAAFQEMFTFFGVIPEIQKSIMLYYYKLNIETIIARKYKYSPKDKYYDKSIQQQDIIKQQLIAKPETPHLLWRD